MAQSLTVLCRLPSGVTLDLHNQETLKQRATASTPMMHPATPLRTVTLNGATHDPSYHSVEDRLLGRAGRTQVDKDFWEAWLKQNEKNQLVTQKLVFAEATRAKADDAMKELKSEKTGLEGAGQDALPKDISKMEKN